MKAIIKISFLFICIVFLFSCGDSSKYKYETVPNDPLRARIYTLDNGLKVYLSVNDERPRIQTNIAVKVGGKNDPAETTGLAHYFEHLMFKGTQEFGTVNYEEEEKLLNRIEELFEVYRKTTGEEERRLLYRQIDSISYEASKYGVANEYDKLMAAIGASGTNAYTGMDMTCYIEDIPSNQIENWAKIQADRFQNNVIRGFHTELETVYEEKNMSLTQDGWKVYDARLAALFPNHPYGTQTVLGTQEHLKNPSITNIKKYYREWYVPNNMAICMAGDFDPDEVIKIIDKYFGGMQPNENLPKLDFKPESPITQPIEKEVRGLDAEFVSMAWRFPGANSRDADIMTLINNILYNGKAGLIDLNVEQKQRVLQVYTGLDLMENYSVWEINGWHKEGQTLEEVKDILLGEVEKLKSGEFDDELIEATINNYKRRLQSQLESNYARVDMFVESFINGIDWKKEVERIDRLSKITKEEIVEYANANLKDNYVVIYKREGKDESELKIAKPQITPILTNRDTMSEFLRIIQETKVENIEPVFVDFKKDMNIDNLKSDIPLLYKQNVTNDLFSLVYVFEMGTNEDKLLGTAVNYLDYLGTSEMSAEEIKQEFYKLACNYYVSTGTERVYIGISGLSENMERALQLLEKLLSDAQPDEEVWENMKEDIFKEREDAKKNQSANYRRLVQYAQYGKNSPAFNILSAQELKELKANVLTEKLKQLSSFEHTILYYGPRTQKELMNDVNTYHQVPDRLIPIPKNKNVVVQLTPTNKFLLAPYDANQIYMASVSNRGEKFDVSIYPLVSMYNEYFGGGMNSIVFQDVREARGLAYNANALLNSPNKLEEPYMYTTFIATQNDKMGEALDVMNDIINNMPESESGFLIAKDALMARLSTQRITKASILWNYLDAKRLGLDYDRRKVLYEKLPTITLEDVKEFQKEWIKGRTYTYCILGNEKDLDIKKLEEMGTVIRLTREQIFGY